jgi:hypothetical protein
LFLLKLEVRSVKIVADTLPEEFKMKLPSIEDLQHEIEAIAAVVEEFDREVDPG